MQAMNNMTTLLTSLPCHAISQINSFRSKAHSKKEVNPRVPCTQRLSHRAHVNQSDEQTNALSSFPQNRERRQPDPSVRRHYKPLNIIDVHIFRAAFLLTFTAVLIELEVAVSVALLAVRISLVDLGRFGQFAVCL